MKTLNIFKTLLLCGVPFVWTSCNNEANEPSNIEDDQFEGIVLSIPNDLAITRANDETPNTSEAEAKISSLTVIAYSTTNGNQIVRSLDNNKLGFVNTAHGYKQVPVQLPADTYHIYVLANIAPTDIEGSNINWSTISETNLKNSNLSNRSVIKASDVTVTGTTRIPMSCHNDDLKESEEGNPIGLNGSITIAKSEKKSVYADLTFCMAKLRVTILNKSNSNLGMGSTPVTLLNTVDKIGSLEKKSGLSITSNQISLTGDYYNCTSETSSDTNVDNLGDIQTSRPDKWAWQTIYYIPERIFNTDENKPTQVKIEFDKDEYNDETKTIRKVQSQMNSLNGVHRSVFYDILGYTTSKDLTLEVRVKDWQYHKYTFNLE